MTAPGRELTTKSSLERRVDELQRLLDAAVEFRFDADLSEVDARHSGVDLTSIARQWALCVVLSPARSWGVRRGLGPLWWSTASEDWVTGYFGIGSLDRALLVKDRVMVTHRELAVNDARRLVSDQIERRRRLLSR